MNPFLQEKIILFSILSMIAGHVYAQNDRTLWEWNSVDDISHITENDLNERLDWEENEDRKTRPVELNLADADDLASIPFLSSAQRRDLGEYINSYGQIYSVSELLAIRGFDSLLVRKIMPYISIENQQLHPKISLRNLFTSARSRLVVQSWTTYPRSVGYRSEADVSGSGVRGYPGSPYGAWFRYTYSYAGIISAGITGDKDPGEQFFAGNQTYGMDQYAAFICYNPNRFIKRIVIGNFRAGWGQGLTFSTGGGPGNYPGFIREIAGTNGIRPSQSVSQNGVLQGAACNLGKGRISFSGFFSVVSKDVNSVSVNPETGETIEFTSFNESGYHRTEEEIRERGKVKEKIFGGNLTFRGNFFSAGVTAYTSEYTASLVQKKELYNLLSFSGRRNFVAGADFNFFLRILRITGEISRCMNGSIAFVGGLYLFPSTGFSSAIILRSYPPEYQNLYSSSFRSSSNSVNEQGVYAGLNFNLPNRIGVSVFADLCRYPWARYQNDISSSGNETGIMLTWRLAELDLAARYSYTDYEIRTQTTDRVNHGITGKKISDLRIQADWQIGKPVSLKGRLELKHSEPGGGQGSWGWVLYQDIAVQISRSIPGFSLRYEVFDCQQYDIRIWAWEPDLLYNYSMQTLYGKGTRISAIVKLRPWQSVELSSKAGLTWYTDREKTGSGMDMINDYRKLDIKIQLRVRF
jgi:hypothetical protein